jgi:hypothetical protein
MLRYIGMAPASTSLSDVESLIISHWPIVAQNLYFEAIDDLDTPRIITYYQVSDVQ